MGLTLDSVRTVCDAVSRQVADSYGYLHIHYVVHHEEHQTEALSLTSHEILTHPAAQSALHLLTKPRNATDSCLLGTAVAHKSIFFGLSRREMFLSLCTMNVDQFETLEDVRREAWHLVWHALDSIQYRNESLNDPENRGTMMVRKRNAVQISHANLKADAFGAFMALFRNDMQAIKETARKRALESLSDIAHHRGDLFPFPLAVETALAASREWQGKPVPRSKEIGLALSLAQQVGRTFDKRTIENWLMFSEAAQDMAWRGFKEQEILGAAINTSESTQVRASAYLVSEITGMKPSSPLQSQEKYSAFADDKFNEALHNSLSRQVFEDVIAQGLKLNSIEPFIRLANEQNERLTDGEMMGWCAGALQNSARTFEHAIADGDDPESLARKTFEEQSERTEWDDLRTLGKQIVARNRKGDTVTLDKLAEMCESGGESLKGIGKAVAATIQDPGYQKKREAAMRPKAPAPAAPGPAPTAPGPKTPAPAPMPVMPAPGMGGRSGVIRSAPVRQPVVQETKTTGQEDSAGTQGI